MSIFKFDSNNNLFCPICESKMKYHFHSEQSFIMKCLNGCFYYNFEYGEIDIEIFKNEFYLSDESKPTWTDKVEREIEYWKENNRYVAKILSE